MREDGVATLCTVVEQVLHVSTAPKRTDEV